MKYVLRQILYLLGVVVGIIMFFGGAFLAFPGFALVVMLPGVNFLSTGHFTLPAEAVEMVSAMGVGVAFFAGGIMLMGFSVNKMGLLARQASFSAIFGLAAILFMWVAVTYAKTLEYGLFMGVLVVICATAALFGPLALAKEN